VSVDQASDAGVPKVLLRLQENYEGSIKPLRDRKAVYRWDVYQTREKHALLDALRRYCIVKLWQVEVALLFFAGEIDEEICTDELRYWKDNYHQIDINSARITPSWLAGFFDLVWMTPTELRVHLRSLSPSIDTTGRTGGASMAILLLNIALSNLT